MDTTYFSHNRFFFFRKFEKKNQTKSWIYIRFWSFEVKHAVWSLVKISLFHIIYHRIRHFNLWLLFFILQFFAWYRYNWLITSTTNFAIVLEFSEFELIMRLYDRTVFTLGNGLVRQAYSAKPRNLYRGKTTIYINLQNNLIIYNLSYMCSVYNISSVIAVYNISAVNPFIVY